MCGRIPRGRIVVEHGNQAESFVMLGSLARHSGRIASELALFRRFAFSGHSSIATQLSVFRDDWLRHLFNGLVIVCAPGV